MLLIDTKRLKYMERYQLSGEEGNIVKISVFFKWTFEFTVNSKKPQENLCVCVCVCVCVLANWF